MCNLRFLPAHTINRRNRSKAITDIEMTDQLCLNIDFSTGQDGAKTCTICIKSHVHCSHCCRLVDSVVESRDFTVRLQYLIRPIIAIEDGDWLDAQPLRSGAVEPRKQPRLVAPVLLTCLTAIQWIMSELV